MFCNVISCSSQRPFIHNVHRHNLWLSNASVITFSIKTCLVVYLKVTILWSVERDTLISVFSDIFLHFNIWHTDDFDDKITMRLQLLKEKSDSQDIWEFRWNTINITWSIWVFYSVGCFGILSKMDHFHASKWHFSIIFQKMGGDVDVVKCNFLTTPFCL